MQRPAEIRIHHRSFQAFLPCRAAPCGSPTCHTAGWLARGAHVTAVGSDMPHKQELDPRILVTAGKYVPDSIEAAAASGELHHALKAGLLEVGSVYGELTAVASGRLAGRADDDELTVADLTGLGIQDAAVAALAVRLTGEQGAGRDVPLGDW